MIKSILFTILFTLVLSLGVQAQSELTVDPVTAVSGIPGGSATVNFNIKNAGVTDKTVLISSTDLELVTDNQVKIIKPSPKTITAKANNTDNAQNFKVDIPSTITGDYSGTISIIDKDNANHNATVGYTVTVNRLISMVVIPTTPNNNLNIKSQEDTTVTTNFVVKNEGSVSFTPELIIPNIIDSNNAALINNVITVSGTTKSTEEIAPNSQLTFTLTSEFLKRLELDNHATNITINTNLKDSTLEDISATIKITLEVEPEICDSGLVGDLRLDIKEPGDNDNFSPGEEIDIETTVDNDHNTKDIDVVVEAWLYNKDEDDKLIEVESTSKEVENGKDEDFDFTLDIPLGEDIDDDDEIVLYIKAYEDGDEDVHCTFESIGIDFDRESHQLAIEEFTANPSALSCNEVVNFAVNVENIGKKEEDDVEVRISHSELGLDYISPRFALDEFDRSDNDARKTFGFTIPKNAEEKTYLIQTEAIFNGGDASDPEFVEIRVTNCDGSESTGTSEDTSSSLLQSSFSITSGRVFAVPVSLQNTGSDQQTYQVEVVPSGDWTTTVTEQTTLNAGQTTTVFVYLTPREDLDQGSYSANINVKQNGNLISTNSITASLGTESSITGNTAFQGTYTVNSFTRNWIDNGRIFWILGIIVLIVLIVFFGKLIMAKRN